MGTKHKTYAVCTAVAVLSIGAFQAGQNLRSAYNRPSAKSMASMQASAMLKLTPESSPVAIDTSKQQGGNEDRELVSSVVRLLRAHYVEPVTKEKETEMARGALRGMIDSLNDPDSRFMDPTERKLLDDAGSGKFHGIGAILALKRDTTKLGPKPEDKMDVTKLVIITPMPGSPADKAGLKPGDSITYVDNKWIISYDPFKEAGLENLAKSVRNKETDELTYQKAYEGALKKLKDGVSILDALESITSKSTGEIMVKVDRPGASKPIEVKLQCRNTVVPSVVSQPEDRGVAYIRVNQFTRNAPAQFASILKQAQSRKAKALVLDLRNNPGGLIDSATNIISKITGGGVVASIQSSKDKQQVRAPRTQKLGIPVVVLVNEGTASVAELAAGTLRDSGTASLIGTKTFGDGMVQTPILLKDGSAAIITTGKMLTVKGTDFTGKGLSPDRTVQQSAKGDTQRQEALKTLLAKIGKA